jgi:tRNA threonylcarbamoyladenosine biosynthesis protein TsaB
MFILAIETTGPKGSVALRDMEGSSGGRTFMRVTDEPMGHLRNLMAMAKELLAEAEIEPKQIGLVACSVGPGSYTGIRIGVSSARAIAQALDVPCVSVGALDQFRQVALSRRRPVAVIFNARRGQVYGAVFDVKRGPDMKAVCDILPPGPYMLTDVLEKTEDLPGVVFYGDGVDAYREKLVGMELSPETERYPTATLTLQAAVDMLRSETPTGYGEMLPRYMRETEAEQKLKDGTLAKLREAKMAKFRSK